jgi:hypothetical protein
MLDTIASKIATSLAVWSALGLAVGYCTGQSTGFSQYESVEAIQLGQRANGSLELCIDLRGGPRRAYVVDTGAIESQCQANQVIMPPRPSRYRLGWWRQHIFFPSFQLGRRLAGEQLDLDSPAAWRERLAMLVRRRILNCTIDRDDSDARFITDERELAVLASSTYCVSRCRSIGIEADSTFTVTKLAGTTVAAGPKAIEFALELRNTIVSALEADGLQPRDLDGKPCAALPLPTDP